MHYIFGLHFDLLKHTFLKTDSILTYTPKVMCQYINYEDNSNDTYLYAIILEDNKKIFYHPLGKDPSIEPIALYDFSVSKGDVVSLGGNSQNLYQQESYLIQDTLVLKNANNCFRGVGAILNDGSYIIIDGDTIYKEFQWYEGIGSIFEPFEKFEWNQYMGGPPCYLYECSVNNEVIYSNTKGLVLSDYKAITSIDNNSSRAKLIYYYGNVYIQCNEGLYTLMGMPVK